MSGDLALRADLPDGEPRWAAPARAMALPLLLLAAWQVWAMTQPDITRAPSPVRVATTFAQLTASGDLPMSLLQSLGRVAGGFAVALVLGIVLGIADRTARSVKELPDLTWRDGIIYGLCQAMALVPGVSRSGATIVGAMLLGATKRAAAEFSFFLAMPTMAVAFAYELLKSRHDLSFEQGGLIAVGFLASFLSGLLVVRALLAYVAAYGFALFGWWRIGLGSLGLALLLAGR